MTTAVGLAKHAFVALITGAYIRANTGGDKTKIAARAQKVVDFATNVQQINKGSIIEALPKLTASLASDVTDPAEQEVFQDTLAFLADHATIAQNLEDTLLGEAAQAAVNDVMAQAVSTAQRYLPKAA